MSFFAVAAEPLVIQREQLGDATVKKTTGPLGADESFWL